ncbi:MAG: substrate-binding domain-containing protein [Planctomycetia bacterium]|jgi:ABC-type molybdate transport system substrate-binding protein
MMKSMPMILAIVLLFAAVGGCGSDSKGTLYVYCDQVIQPAIEKIVEEFQAKSGYQVELILDPEDRVFRRMKLSEHADLYISMVPSLVDRTISLGRSKKAVPICYMVPVMMTASLNPNGMDSIDDFKKADTRFGLCDEDTILGDTSKRILEKNDFPWKDAYPLLHLPARDEETLISSIHDCVINVAIVWGVTAQHADRVEVVKIPKRENVRLPIFALELTKSKHPEATAELVKFMKSPAANKIWKENGMDPYNGKE